MKKLEVYLSPLAEFKLGLLLALLEKDWGLKSKKKFLNKLEKSKTKISVAPKSCERSEEFAGIYKCVVTRQTSFFYRIEKDEIEIVTVIDNRQNPDQVSAELKNHFG